MKYDIEKTIQTILNAHTTTDVDARQYAKKNRADWIPRIDRECSDLMQALKDVRSMELEIIELRRKLSYARVK